jgi:enduracididine biosynthesis enzyme MppP
LNLTELEILALDSPVNVSDGHARQSLTEAQSAVVREFPELFESASRQPFGELERRAQSAFLSALGQHRAPVCEGRVFSTYSSSVGMEIVARCLAEELSEVALIHPTFDNIPDLLKARGLSLRPVEEQALEGDPEHAFAGRPQAVFITTPNNPTGFVLSADALRRVAGWCAEHRAVLCLDTSFRGFDPTAQYDTYAILEEAATEYVVIEDTGKLWPMAELKLGFVVHSRNCRLGLQEAVSDVLLSVSPFVLLVVERLAEDAAAGGLDDLHDLIARNRAILESSLSSTSAHLPDRGRVSVARVGLAEGMSAASLWRALRKVNVDALPCGSFHWADQAEGDGFLRVALARDEPVVQKAAEAVGGVIELVRREGDRVAAWSGAVRSA